MRRRSRLALGAGAVIAAAAVAGVILLAGGSNPAGPSTAVLSTATVQRGSLAAAVSQDGILTYRARPDGSPFAAVNHARGTYTRLPAAGERAACGDVLYRVDDHPVLLLCGPIPAYRALRAGDTGRDVRQLNRFLRLRGDVFTTSTQRALEALQRRRGARVTGALALGDAVVLPGPVRVAKVVGALGGAAQPGAPVLTATSGTLRVQVDLDPSDQGRVRRGDRAQVTLPGETTVSGRVVGFGRIATSAGPGAPAAGATVPTYVDLDRPGRARGFDQAPVGVSITIAGVANALSVPVTALVGRTGGGFAVEVVRRGQRRDLVPVRLGLFDTGGGRVQVQGALHPGDAVAVPSL